MKHRVHIYAIVRVPVEVEAESQQEAIKKAEESVDLHSMFRQGENEFAEDTDGYLVDTYDGDDRWTPSESRWYTAGGEIDREMHPTL